MGTALEPPEALVGFRTIRDSGPHQPRRAPALPPDLASTVANQVPDATVGALVVNLADLDSIYQAGDTFELALGTNLLGGPETMETLHVGGP